MCPCAFLHHLFQLNEKVKILTGHDMCVSAWIVYTLFACTQTDVVYPCVFVYMDPCTFVCVCIWMCNCVCAFVTPSLTFFLTA